jgi:hypothetical protein
LFFLFRVSLPVTFELSAKKSGLLYRLAKKMDIHPSSSTAECALVSTIIQPNNRNNHEIGFSHGAQPEFAAQAWANVPPSIAWLAAISDPITSYPLVGPSVESIFPHGYTSQQVPVEIAYLDDYTAMPIGAMPVEAMLVEAMPVEAMLGGVAAMPVETRATPDEAMPAAATPLDVMAEVALSSHRLPCQICGYSFDDGKESFQTHMKIHNVGRERPFQCGGCEEAFRRIYDLERHQASVRYIWLFYDQTD